MANIKFEVPCYKTHKCHDDKTSVDTWQNSERNIQTDPNKSNNLL